MRTILQRKVCIVWPPCIVLRNFHLVCSLKVQVHCEDVLPAIFKTITGQSEYPHSRIVPKNSPNISLRTWGWPAFFTSNSIHQRIQSKLKPLIFILHCYCTFNLSLCLIFSSLCNVKNGYTMWHLTIHCGILTATFTSTAHIQFTFKTI